MFLKDATGPISPFHDIPLVANAAAKTYHAVIEVPRWTNAKMEIDTKSPLNPIVQVGNMNMGLSTIIKLFGRHSNI